MAPSRDDDESDDDDIDGVDDVNTDDASRSTSLLSSVMLLVSLMDEEWAEVATDVTDGNDEPEDTTDSPRANANTCCLHKTPSRAT